MQKRRGGDGKVEVRSHNKTKGNIVLMAKSESKMCEECGVLENVEHVALYQV